MPVDNCKFLCRRMKKLREDNGLSMEKIAKKLNRDKASISRVESGQRSDSAVLDLAKEYCAEFGMDTIQTEQFLRGNKIVILDTSALLKNSQLVEELSEEYSKVIIPKIVIDELSSIKNKKRGSLSRKAGEIINSIGADEKTLQRAYTGDNPNENNDCKIIQIAKQVSGEYGCEVDILTSDADYSAYLKGAEGVKALPLQEYTASKQTLVNMTRIKAIDKYYALTYEDIPAPTKEEANAYFENGNTLLISTVRNKKASLNERKAKIKWLMEHGADINKRDCSRRYFPPLSHAIQMGDYEMFLFLLKKCHADPNVASRNPHDAGKLRQKNEGNMPLMIAAWEGKAKFVKTLCEDSRTSINQQDANGFTALIKACANLHFPCRDILLEHGADKRIVDINGKNYKDHMREAQALGPLRTRGRGNRR